MTEQELGEALRSRITAFPGKVQMIFEDLQDPSDRFALNEQEPVVSASTIKPAVLACLQDELGARGKTLQDSIAIRKEDLLDDSLVFDAPGEKSFYEVAWWMITNSDNTAANVLMQYLGFDRINRWCRDHGLNSTKACRLMLDYQAIKEGRNNWISPADFEKLVLWEYRTAAGILPASDAEKKKAEIFCGMMRGNRDFDALLRYIYEAPVCLHKSGDLDTVAHDAGIFAYAGRSWFLGIFTSEYRDGMDFEKARAFIGKLSRLVFTYMKEKLYEGETMKPEQKTQDSSIYAYVRVPEAFLHEQDGTVSDELLMGEAVRILEDGTDLVPVETSYGYQGLCRKEDLLPADGEMIRDREKSGTVLTVTRRAVDLLLAPKVQGQILCTLSRGSIVTRCEDSADAAAEGYTKVSLPDGRSGYLPSCSVSPRRDTDRYLFSRDPKRFLSQDVLHQWKEEDLRSSVTRAAQQYLGAIYRWGGTSGNGIDCSGLVFMSYRSCGILIYRDAAIRPEYPIHEIPWEKKAPGDLLYMKGHVAMYLGNGKYIHSTGYARDFGVVYGSLIPDEPEYREDLEGKWTAVGSLFPLPEERSMS